MQMTLPASPVHPKSMLPIFQQMTNSFVGVAVEKCEQQGYKISCKAGCGACCRQMVPIAEIEARRLAELIAALPEPRQSEIRRRFQEAAQKLEEAGLLGPLLDVDKYSDDELKARASTYFRLGIPCPFLEEESCSIHPDRPLACREYLVTSSPEFCKDPRVDDVRGVIIPVFVSNAVMSLSEPRFTKSVPFVPMTLLLDWVESHPDRMESAPGPEIFKKVIENLSGKPLPGTSAAAAAKSD